MALAGMIAFEEEAFICDMAETYHVLDYRALPVPLLITLSSGLGLNSRVKRKQMKMEELHVEYALASIADYLKLIYMAMAAKKSQSDIFLFSEYVMGNIDRRENKTVSYNSGTDFDQARKSILGA